MNALRWDNSEDLASDRAATGEVSANHEIIRWRFKGAPYGGKVKELAKDDFGVSKYSILPTGSRRMPNEKSQE